MHEVSDIYATMQGYHLNDDIYAETDKNMQFLLLQCDNLANMDDINS